MKTNWLDKNEYPFKENYFEIEGHRLHYVDEGAGPTIVYVHGTPSWSFDFRNVIKALQHRYRFIALDHLGFGLSDKPASFGYSTQKHSSNLERFIAFKGLKDITLVVHDFGGPIGLNFAIHHPHLVKNMVILNSWFWSTESDPAFQKLRRLLKNPLLPFLYRHLNLSPKFLLPDSFGNKKLSSKILKQYTSPFSCNAERKGPLAFARSLLHDQQWFEELWKKGRSIAGKPTLFIWGVQDKMMGIEYLRKFESAFANHETIELEGCGHFPQEEEAGAVAIALNSWLEKQSLQSAQFSDDRYARTQH